MAAAFGRARAALWHLALVSLVALGVAGQANALNLTVAGNLSLQIATLDPVVIVGTPFLSAVNGSTGSAGDHLAKLPIGQGAFSTTGIVLPVTDPGAAPIGGIQVTVGNAAGTFDNSPEPFGGIVPLTGAAKVCLFGPCSAAVQNLTVPLAVVGNGGSTFVNNAVKITVIGAPWTTGTAQIGTITQMGGAHGPASTTSSTAAPSGTVSLVTPVFVSTNIPASAVVPVFAFADLHFVPEPGTLLLLGSGITGLVLFGRSRRS
jgi:hypothetical protein